MHAKGWHSTSSTDMRNMMHVLSRPCLCLQSFMASGRAQADFQPMPLPQLRLSVQDQCRLRDRSTIMARQMYATQGSDYADAQVHMQPATWPHSIHAVP